MGALKENISSVACDVFPAHLSGTKVRIRNAILRYVRRHPDVADTADGIVVWWLPCKGYENAPDYIESVLEELVAGKLLEAIKLPDGEILYRPGGALSTGSGT